MYTPLKPGLKFLLSTNNGETWSELEYRGFKGLSRKIISFRVVRLNGQPEKTRTIVRIEKRVALDFQNGLETKAILVEDGFLTTDLQPCLIKLHS